MSEFLRLHRKHFNLQKFISDAVKEDVGDGDHTSLSIIPAKQRNTMKLLVKEEGVVAGVDAAERILRFVDKTVVIKTAIADGTKVRPGDVVFTASGNTRKLLLAERLLLNVMQRMSGVATKTNQLQLLCKGTRARVTDTRKTTPGFRFFQKWAVEIGGGVNHRFGLYDMILIKDNHIDFAGGIENAIQSANNYLKTKKLQIPIEVETRSIDDVERVLRFGKVQRIMLDNYSVRETKRAVKLIKGRFDVESSGGITEKNLRSYAMAGPDFISIGALTHHVKSLDLSFKAVSGKL